MVGSSGNVMPWSESWSETFRDKMYSTSFSQVKKSKITPMTPHSQVPYFSDGRVMSQSMSSWPLIQSVNKDTLLLCIAQILSISILILGNGGIVDTKSPTISMPAMWWHKKTRHDHLYGRVGIWHRRSPKCAGFTLFVVWGRLDSR